MKARRLIIRDHTTGYGKSYCKFCEKSVVSYNMDRHERSNKHIASIKKYEIKNDVIVIENFDKIGKTEMNRILKKKWKQLQKKQS